MIETGHNARKTNN